MVCARRQMIAAAKLILASLPFFAGAIAIAERAVAQSAGAKRSQTAAPKNQSASPAGSASKADASKTATGAAAKSKTNADASQAAAAASNDKAKPAPQLPYSIRPYRIRVWFDFAPDTRLDSLARSRLIEHWLALVKRFIGPPWDLDVAADSGPLAERTFEAITPKNIADMAPGYDKAFIIVVARRGSGLGFRGREYDATTFRLSTPKDKHAPFIADAPRALFDLSLAVFEPSAEIGESSQGGVTITVQGGELPVASPIGAFVRGGAVFRPIRIYLKPDKSVLQVLDIPYSYLMVESIDKAKARCMIVSSQSDPLTKRSAKKTKLVALGVKPTSNPIKLRFLTRPDRKPAAGYVLTATPVPKGKTRPVGLTDRQGRVEFNPIPGQGLIKIDLMAGDSEPLIEFPVMPGETHDGRPILVDPKSQTVALETEINALRDDIIDQIIVRRRIEKFLKAREAGNQWDEIERLLEEFKRLPPKTSFAERVAKLKDDAKKRQAESKKPIAILTKNAQGLIADTEAMIEGYLIDDTFAAYTEALEQRKAPANPPGRSIAAPAAKPQAAAPAAKPQPARSAPAQPQAKPSQPKNNAPTVAPF
jgi:hypothetical protein